MVWEIRGRSRFVSTWYRDYRFYVSIGKWSYAKSKQSNSFHALEIINQSPKQRQPSEDTPMKLKHPLGLEAIPLQILITDK